MRTASSQGPPHTPVPCLCLLSSQWRCPPCVLAAKPRRPVTSLPFSGPWPPRHSLPRLQSSGPLSSFPKPLFPSLPFLPCHLSLFSLPYSLPKLLLSWSSYFNSYPSIQWTHHCQMNLLFRISPKYTQNTALLIWDSTSSDLAPDDFPALSHISYPGLSLC